MEVRRQFYCGQNEQDRVKSNIFLFKLSNEDERAARVPVSVRGMILILTHGALNSAALDSAALDSAALDSAALDSAALDSAALDSAALDSAMVQWLLSCFRHYIINESGTFV